MDRMWESSILNLCSTIYISNHIPLFVLPLVLGQLMWLLDTSIRFPLATSHAVGEELWTPHGVFNILFLSACITYSSPMVGVQTII